MKKRIWFNRWFSTAYHFIEAIKNNPDGMEFEIFGTHSNPNTVYFHVCDHSETEPEIDGEAYIQYCVDFCKKNQINVFIPYQHALEISKQLKRFDEVGTRVLVIDDYSLMETISDKGKLYESFEKNGLEKYIPDYHIVTTAEQFAKAYHKLHSCGKTVCVKPVDGRGGEGFRVIKREADGLKDLFGYISHKVSYNDAYKILASEASFQPLMVLEYLADFEYSIDCLAYGGELLAAVPRKKAGGRIRELKEVPELLQLAQSIHDVYNIPYVYNVQVKYNQGVPKLLEINPRMSGGLHISTLSGVNFPYLAVKLLLTGDARVEKPVFDIRATHIENAVILENGQMEKAI
ncbi:ATP-grasp domain-containing protein [Peribacillus loiseleuriae]|uniref:ATP-grasp domain-containing protein n=1 Tax=Peribacillus loiseleuriae TaxID=1679170 RepID=UPI0037FAA8D0